MSEVKEYITRNFGDKIYFGTPVTKNSTGGAIDIDFSEEKVCATLITSMVIQPFNVGGTMTMTDTDTNRIMIQLLNAFTQPLYYPFDYVTFGPAIRLKFDTVNVFFTIIFEKLYSRDSQIKIEDLLNGKTG